MRRGPPTRNLNLSECAAPTKSPSDPHGQIPFRSPSSPSVELRKVVHSTDATGSLNALSGKRPSDAAISRPNSSSHGVYLTAVEKRKNRTNRTGRINSRKSILNTLSIQYSGPPHRGQPTTKTTPPTRRMRQSRSRSPQRAPDDFSARTAPTGGPIESALPGPHKLRPQI